MKNTTSKKEIICVFIQALILPYWSELYFSIDFKRSYFIATKSMQVSI